MKNLFKCSSAFCVSVCLLLMVFASPEIASAATKITNSAGTNISVTYEGNMTKLKTTSNTAVYYYSSDKSVATIGRKTGVMKSISKGTVVIRAVSRKTGKLIAKQTFTVKKRSKLITLNVSEALLAPGETITIAAALEPVDSTDVICFYSSDENVASVDVSTGEVTAVADGTAMITVYAKAREKSQKSSKYNRKATVSIIVQNKISSVTPVSYNKLETEFTSFPSEESMSVENFVLTKDSTGAVIPIKSVGLSSGKAIIELDSYLFDGGKYTLAYKASSKTFTAPVMLSSLPTVPIDDTLHVEVSLSAETMDNTLSSTDDLDKSILQTTSVSKENGFNQNITGTGTYDEGIEVTGYSITIKDSSNSDVTDSYYEANEGKILVNKCETIPGKTCSGYVTRMPAGTYTLVAHIEYSIDGGETIQKNIFKDFKITSSQDLENGLQIISTNSNITTTNSDAQTIASEDLRYYFNGLVITFEIYQGELAYVPAPNTYIKFSKLKIAVQSCGATQEILDGYAVIIDVTSKVPSGLKYVGP